MIIVSKDGSGDYTSIQEAVDAAPDGRRSPTIILVRMNEYQECVVIHKDNIRVIGEARDRTVLTAPIPSGKEAEDAAAQPSAPLFTLLITGRNVEVENLTIRYDVQSSSDGQFPCAVYAAGDRGVWRNCRIFSSGCALLCTPVIPMVEELIFPRISHAEHTAQLTECPVTESRQYFEFCHLQGSSQVACGAYSAWFEQCTLCMDADGGCYTDAWTPEGQAYGMVFHRSTLTGTSPESSGCLVGGKKNGKAVFLECSMDEHVKLQTEGECAPEDAYALWRTNDSSEKNSLCQTEKKELTQDEASIYNIPEVIGGYDRWRPDMRTPTWFLCGDSTMANYPPDAAPMTGWGQALQSLLPETVFVENCAVCGRSSKSFIAEKRLGFIELCLRRGDKLIISFSHNDEKKDPLRYTSPRTTFPEYLDMYIDAARAHGAEPILATPIARRHFDESGRLMATHGDYPDAMRAHASLRGVRLVEMEKATMELVQKLGDAESKTLYCHVPANHPNYPDGAADNSHLHLRGAIRYASLFLSMLRGEKVTEGQVFSRNTGDVTGLIDKEDSVLR